ncbi:MAG: hypothetical protein OQJ93_02365 [Ignavibacteriaceae bacterium]|jgi:hypothetical protein|nr:hypothetical protein [Ignavibacteriaceae bacterium]MCW8813566.1 hypothetical protein [Chlorobium sp.]MCW8995964.1 hypothetical protein [Psychromonas sp.]MCW8816391.1 hypothetical protein [Ignavibacteriaceae bacterium]MCW8823141.1 hypothetical protein [Ignavibacteriaceae bacterium]
MKRINSLIKINVFLLPFSMLLLISGCSSSENQNSMNGTEQQGAYNIDELNSYGEWVHVDPYGEVWEPFVVNGWMPFDNGHWAYADANWTWVSYEPFGWIVYHYGYWYDDPFYGWVWVPGDGAWSPANVTWINYGNYVGWAPLGPRGVVYGHPWDKDQDRFWHVVKRDDFTRDNIRDFRVMNPVRGEIDGKTIINKPPDRQLIEKTIGKPVPEVNMQHETVKLQNTEINRMNLPPGEHQRVEQQTPRVKKDVLVPREEFHQQHQTNKRSK